MGDCKTYEVRVDGPLSDQLMAALGVSAVEESAQTVILTAPIDQGGLLGLIDRVSAFGLELVEVRRVSPATDKIAGRECYELSVRGLLGPALLTALAGLSSGSARRSNSWTFRCSAPHGLTALLQSLATHHTAIMSLHRIGCTAGTASRDATFPTVVL
jgi:hypothetical protein